MGKRAWFSFKKTPTPPRIPDAQGETLQEDSTAHIDKKPEKDSPHNHTPPTTQDDALDELSFGNNFAAALPDADADEPARPPPPMWSNRAPPPKPLWSNKPPAAAAASADESEESPGSRSASFSKPPPPMWSNRKPAAGAPAARVAPTPPPVPLTPSPQPMRSRWSDREPKEDDGKKYIKQYELGHSLGKGSYAKVKLCYDIEQEREEFAMKIFNTSLLKRRRTWSSSEGYTTAFDDVLREIAIMRKISHEHVVALRDVIDDSHINKLYMVMTYCSRGALMDSQKLPCEPLPFESARKWFADSVLGLDYLHFQDIVHFDLKPDNILITDDGRALIADFGVSRTILDGTRASGSPGTPSYTAPEVWGTGKYEAKKSDIWSLGATLHAMVFGTLPYLCTDQQQLIDMVTAPEEWECTQQAHADDADFVDLLRAMLRKQPKERANLDAIKAHPWLDSDLKERVTVPLDRIEVDEEEIRSAVITGHVESFRRTPEGRLLKTTWRQEGDMYMAMSQSRMRPFLPTVHDFKESLGGRVIIEMDDLTRDVQDACLMDIKMGVRTFTETDVSTNELRADLLQKMLKVDPKAATPDEVRQGGITKLRYLQFRESTTTTLKLGFRIDAVRLAGGVGDDNASLIDQDRLRTVETEGEARDVLLQFIRRRPDLRASFEQNVTNLRDQIEKCDCFMGHSFIRTSLLFIYSNVTHQTSVHVIDLSRAYDAERVLTHRSAWESGNHEDGYLTGVDNIIRILKDMKAETLR